MLAIVLALGTSLAYGTANFLGPLFGRRHPVAAVLLAGQLAALAAAAVFVVASGEGMPPARAVVLGLLAGAGNVLGLATFFRAAQLGSVSLVAALGATGTALPVFYGLVTGESLTALQAAGIVLAVVGGVLAAQSGAHAEISAAGIGWSLVSACGFGTLLVFLPLAAEDGTAWALLDARVAVVVLLAGGVAALRLPVATDVRAVPRLSLPGLLLLAGTLMYAEASQRGLLSVVAVLASLATVVTATYAFFIDGERLSRAQRAGIAFATVGVILLAV